MDSLDAIYGDVQKIVDATWEEMALPKILNWTRAISRSKVNYTVKAIPVAVDTVLLPQNNKRIYVEFRAAYAGAIAIGITINQAASPTIGMALGTGASAAPRLSWSMRDSGPVCQQEFHANNFGAGPVVVNIIEVIAEECCWVNIDEDPYGDSASPPHM